MEKDSEFRGLITENIDDANVVVAGVPYDLGCSCEKGASKAPDTMRELSAFLPPLTFDGTNIQKIKMYDFGNLKVGNLEDIYTSSEKLFDNSKFKLILGGDHSISISLEKRFYEKTIKEGKIPAIIHIDAHPDICDFYDGSYTSHACPNRRAIGLGVKPENIIMIGIRGYEEQEVEYFVKHPELKVYQAKYINDNGIDKMLEEIISKFSNPKYEVYLSYDIDANDPSFAPGTGTPEAFGLNSYTLLKVILKLVGTLNINIMDIVEVSPPIDCNNITSWLALKTIYEVFNVLINRNHY